MSAKQRRKARQWKARYLALQEVVVALYTSAMWKPDRYVENEDGLWETLRDRAGIAEGTKTNLNYKRAAIDWRRVVTDQQQEER